MKFCQRFQCQLGGDHGVDPEMAVRGYIWSENALLLWRGTSGISLACCHCDLILDKWNKMDGWMDDVCARFMYYFLCACFPHLCMCLLNAVAVTKLYRALFGKVFFFRC